MAGASASAPTRTVFLLHGEDSFRTRLRLAELVASLSGTRAEPPATSDLSRWPTTDLGTPIGVTRHDARSDSADVILMSGQAQGLFAALDERRVVIVEHAEALVDHAFLGSFPDDSALVLVTVEKLPAPRRRAPARPKKSAAASTGGADLPGAVTAASGVVERIPRLTPAEVPAWIEARAALIGVALSPGASSELAGATVGDSDRIERELEKLKAFAAGRKIEAEDVRALVAGAIENDVFALTEAVVRRDVRTATTRLDQLLEDGQAPQQILALLLWQFRTLLFAAAMKTNDDATRMAKAIRASSPNALFRWQAQARRLTRKDIERAYESLYATDLAIKQGRTDAETAMLLCVLDLCGVANADPRDLVVGEPPRR